MRLFSRLTALAALVACALAAPAFAAPQVNVTVQAGVQGDYTNTSGAAAQDAHLATSSNILFTTGTGADQANKLYTEAVSIAASGSESDDLTGLTDALGAALNFGAVKAIVLFCDSTNTNDIVLGNAASNGFAAMFDAATDTLTCKPGGKIVLINPTAAGWTVDSTHKLLKLANSSSGTGVTGKLFIIGQ